MVSVNSHSIVELTTPVDSEVIVIDFGLLFVVVQTVRVSFPSGCDYFHPFRRLVLPVTQALILTYSMARLFVLLASWIVRLDGVKALLESCL